MKRQRTATVHLPQTCDAGQNAEPASLPILTGFGEQLVIAQLQRARPYQAHVPTEYIKELGQLINARLAQELAHGGEAGIVSDLEHRPARLVQVLDLALPLFRIRHHGAELVQAEPALVQAHAVLNE